MRGTQVTAWLAPLWLGACALGTPCERGDWYAMGEADGRSGAGASAIDQRAEQCAILPAAAEAESYEAGRAAGLNRFCRPQRAFDAGVAGYDLDADCLDVADYRLHTAYELGLAQRALRTEVAKLNAEIAVLVEAQKNAASLLEKSRGALSLVDGDSETSAMVTDLNARIADLSTRLAELRRTRTLADEALRAHRRTAALQIAALD
ncbi:MAG: DUF2799 domain-containing protein [Pseudomonadota bacterium]